MVLSGEIDVTNSNEQKEEHIDVDTMQHRANMLNRFKKEYKQFIDDNMCVYKLCMGEWLVIVRKITNGTNSTIDNESRNVSDPLYAKFRASVLFVNVIVNIKTGKTIDHITNICKYNYKQLGLDTMIQANTLQNKFFQVLEFV